MRLWLRALLMSILLCGVVLVLGLVRSSWFVGLWVFWFPGIALVSYPLGIGAFDLELHPMSALLIVLVDVAFWWLVVYLVLRLWRSWRSRRQGTT
jgi:hypothetical protein